MAAGGVGARLPRGPRPPLAKMRWREVAMRLGQEKKGKPGRKIQKACGKGLSGHLLQSGWLSPLWAFFFKGGLVIAFPLSG